ncbi:hypothetical protein ASD65_09485 [Microbacterium sp. Root61]|uniref:D-arabinono-1,4-lactone oxidase n=1 Tax=Microbacterium sp. Root61 TaxID=1736570 RepID=UPI0006FA3934|nr:D-arabinono-1,4-lactone oxidase [Microbacterium sp. Root61]KRA24615.1 hypothetical protein ASD65_09485 [Microbacterium sp. Root61]
MARNWAGTYEYTAARIVEATTEEDVRRAVAAGGRVHALGTGHSFTDLPDTTGTLIGVRGLEGGFALDEDARTVTVASGTRYGTLAMWLDARGWALHNMGSLPHISVGGATATSTHGSGDGNGVLSTAVRSIRYIGADGDAHEVRRGDADFDALVVGVGAYGIVVALTLDVRPSFRVRQDIYTGVSWDAALADLAALTSAGYSVSIFTRWESHSVDLVWVKSLIEADTAVVADDLLDGRRDPAVHSPLGEEFIVTDLGTPGSWTQRLPHFRLDSEPSFGDEIQSEYFVPRADAPAALNAVRALADRIRPLLIWSELRTAAADDLWLSPAYERDVLAIHFTWRNAPDAVAAVIPAIEDALAPFAARPHWAKFHTFDAAALRRVHPRLADARAVFERLDPDGRFTNAHLERVGLRS